jgi:hypothetical protein
VKLSLLGGTDGSSKREYRSRPEVVSVLFASTGFSRWYSLATISGDVFEQSPAAANVAVKRAEVLQPRRSDLFPNFNQENNFAKSLHPACPRAFKATAMDATMAARWILAGLCST